MSIRQKASHFISWHRRALAVILAVIGALALIAHFNSPPPETVAAVTVRQDLAAGEVITSRHIAVALLPPDSVPADALSTIDDAVGRSTITALSANSVLSVPLLRHQQVAAPGRSLVPIVLHNSALHTLLLPGVVVSLTISHSDGTDVVTDDAVVAALPEQPTSSNPSSPGGSDDVVIVDVPSEIAGTVAALGQQGALAVILSGV